MCFSLTLRKIFEKSLKNLWKIFLRIILQDIISKYFKKWPISYSWKYSQKILRNLIFNRNSIWNILCVLRFSKKYSYIYTHIPQNYQKTKLNLFIYLSITENFKEWLSLRFSYTNICYTYIYKYKYIHIYKFKYWFIYKKWNY